MVWTEQYFDLQLKANKAKAFIKVQEKHPYKETQQNAFFKVLKEILAFFQ